MSDRLEILQSRRSAPRFLPESAPTGFGRIRSWSRRAGTRAIVVYALLAAIADFPIWPGDPSKVPTTVGEDIVQTAWFLEWTPWALLHGHNLFETSLINVPNPVDLAQNTGIPLLGLLTAPLTLTAGPIASMNLLRWVAFWLSAYAAFAVIRRWTRWTPAAFVGGLLYGFSPYMVAQGSVHLNLIFVPLPPVIFYLLGELTIFQNRSPYRTGALLGIASVGQFYISSEVLATTYLVAGIAGFFLFFSCAREVPRRWRHGLAGLATAAVVLLPLIGYPVWLTFHGAGHYTGPAQGFNNVYNADLLGTVIPTANQLFAPARLSAVGSNLVGSNLQENGSYLGIPLLIILLVIVVRYWRRLWTIFLALMILTVSALSLGPVLLVDGKVKSLPFDLPFRKIDHLPGIDNILPVRFSLYVAFFVAVLLAIGIEAYRNDLLDRRMLAGDAALSPSVILGRIACVVLAGAAFLALIPNWPYKALRVAPNVAERPKSLAIIPNGSTVLTYPYATPFADQAMLWQALDDMRFRILGSYALTAASNGQASVFPSTLHPSDVEAMLVNSITPTPDPDLAPLVATAKTILAQRVIVEPSGSARPKPAYLGDIVGKVTAVDAKTKSFVMDITNTTPEGVDLEASTAYVEPGVRRPSAAAIAPGEWVIVSGPTTIGTVTPRLVAQLRQFLRTNHVDAIVDDLGLRDSWEIGLWIDAAIGRPTRAGGGGLIWIDVPERLRANAR